jgi:excisionase family DNA binding protein
MNECPHRGRPKGYCRPSSAPSPQGRFRRPPIDTADAARYLGTTERHVRRLVQERRIPFFKVGWKVRFSPDDLDEWLEGFRVDAVR